MIFGGSSAQAEGSLRPVGAVALAERSSIWTLGDAAKARFAQAGTRRVLVIRSCGVSNAELDRMAEHGAPGDAALRWPGAYTVVEETPDAVVIHTDPAAACPVYTTS